MQPLHRPSREASLTTAQCPIVAIIDDEEAVGEAMQDLLETVALKVELFGSVEAFLHASRLTMPNCIVSDIRLPGMSGLDLQAQLVSANSRTPIVFITAHGDIPMSVHAMKAGAIDFLSKPCRDQDLLDAVRHGIEFDRMRRAEEQASAELRSRFESLTPRERATIHLVAAGKMNKQIAAQLGISPVTARVHRYQIMQKMGARSMPDLVRMADSLDGASAIPTLIPSKRSES
jgi:FixJ family two-component response regulator